MPKLDQCHHQVVRSLQKAGWTVAPKATKLYSETRQIFIDIRAWRQVNGTSQQVLLAEVKCFPDRRSLTTDLYIAFGQYIVYRALLAELEDYHPLYLTIPDDIYENNFDSSLKRAVRDNQIKLLIVNLESEVISQWIE